MIIHHLILFLPNALNYLNLKWGGWEDKSILYSRVHSWCSRVHSWCGGILMSSSDIVLLLQVCLNLSRTFLVLLLLAPLAIPSKKSSTSSYLLYPSFFIIISNMLSRLNNAKDKGGILLMTCSDIMILNPKIFSLPLLKKPDHSFNSYLKDLILTGNVIKHAGLIHKFTYADFYVKLASSSAIVMSILTFIISLFIFIPQEWLSLANISLIYNKINV